TAYYYVVKTVTADGTSLSSAEASDSTHALPAPPDRVTASATSASAITVSWDGVTGATKYLVYRGASSGVLYTLVNAVNAPTITFTNTGLTSGTSYYYVVKATTADGTSINSTEANATTL